MHLLVALSLLVLTASAQRLPVSFDDFDSDNTEDEQDEDDGFCYLQLKCNQPRRKAQAIKGEAGDPGPMGPVGIPGLHGSAGPPGEDGLMGESGRSGARGESGPSGFIGEPGLPGSVGSSGLTGDAGEPGPEGERGPEGIIGISAGCDASFYAGLASHIGPLAKGTVVKPEAVMTNVGGVYNAETGRFTAPIDGTFFFYVTIAATEGASATVKIKVDDRTVYTVHSDSLAHWGPSSGTVILALWKGQDVWLVVDTDKSYLYGNKYTTFSGHCLSNRGSVAVITPQ